MDRFFFKIFRNFTSSYKKKIRGFLIKTSLFLSLYFDLNIFLEAYFLIYFIMFNNLLRVINEVCHLIRFSQWFILKLENLVITLNSKKENKKNEESEKEF